MSVSRLALAFLLLAAPLAGSALADDEVLTATTRPKLPTEADLAKAKAENDAKPKILPSNNLTTEQQIALWHAKAEALDAEATAAKRQIHGEVGVSVGTGGYRSAYVASVIPIGENGTLGIAIGQTDFGKFGAPYGGYYGDGYGGYSAGYYGSPYGHPGYGWGRRGGGTSQSIALSLDMRGTETKGKPDTPEGCAPGFRDGDRYVEPLWVTQTRGARECNTSLR